MTIRQAFKIWSNTPDNLVLASRSRGAVQAVLMKKYSDIELEQVTPLFASRIFEKSSQPKDIKVKAAAVLVYLLKWGYENGHCNMPAFDHTICNSNSVDNTPKEASTTKEPVVTVKPEALEKRKLELEKKTEKQEVEQKSNTEMRKSAFGRNPVKVVQIEPTTLKVLKVWDSISEAEKSVGTHNIKRAIERKGTAGGYHWCFFGDEATFNPAQPNTHTQMREPKNESGVLFVNKPSLAEVSNDELIAEMKRRGWKGTITMTLNVEL